MKKTILLLAIIFTGSFIAQAGLKADDNKKNNKANAAGTKSIGNNDLNNSGKLLPPSPSTIDIYDTVMFDMSQAVYNGSYVEFPVYFKSDDVIYAFDFSLKYNMIDFVFDTVIDLTTYLLSSSYFNPGDSTIRFTSSSLIPISNNTPLAVIRFDTLAGPICAADIHTLKGYLNGEQWCTEAVVDCVPLGITENGMNNNSVTIYPNPTSGMINILFNADAVESHQLFVTDITGKIVYKKKFVSTFGKNNLNADLQNLSQGVYQVQMVSSSQSYSQKLVLK